MNRRFRSNHCHQDQSKEERRLLWVYRFFCYLSQLTSRIAQSSTCRNFSMKGLIIVPLQLDQWRIDSFCLPLLQNIEVIVRCISIPKVHILKYRELLLKKDTKKWIIINSIFMYRIKFFCGSVNHLLLIDFSNETCILRH